jgi:P4 family phage/plasmid primase-like protien
LILLGPTAGNGKSAALDLFRALLGSSAVTAIPPNKFREDSYVARLPGKLLNAADELSTSVALASDKFKAIVTGEPIPARALYSQPFIFRPTAVHVFATNALPPFRGGVDAGIRRRLAILLFDRVIPPEERIPHIGQRIGELEADQLLDFAVEGAMLVIANGGYPQPESSQRALREWLSEDPVIAWVEQRVDTSDEEASVRTKEAYMDFQNWMYSEGYQERELLGMKGFTRRIQSVGMGITKGRRADGAYLRGMALRPSTAAAKRLSLVAGAAGDTETGNN